MRPLSYSQMTLTQSSCLLSVWQPNIVPKRRPVRPFFTSRTRHSSKAGLSARVLVKQGACADIGIWSLDCLFCSGRSILMTRTTGFRSVEGENRIQVFEQEGLIDGDLELRAEDGGLEATLNRLSKWLVCATFCAIFIWKHDAEAMWLLTGSILNNILSTIFKQVLNQDRPVSTLKSDPGMPSSHAQSIFFVAAYLILLMTQSLGLNALTLPLSALVFAFGSYLSWLRVSQQFHTVSQVAVGAILGSAFSVFWFWSWGAIIHEAYISYLWVRVCIILGAAGFFSASLLHLIRWLKENS